MKNKRGNNLLNDAVQVVYTRNTQKTLEYGPFTDSMASAAKIATEMTGLNIDTKAMFKIMMALKLARLKYSDKEDTYLDLLAYTGGLHKFLEDEFEATTQLKNIPTNE
jgi:Domain of unknown function (DUF6378)